MAQQLILSYTPRPYQLNLEKGLISKKRAIAIWHRRAGKDVACWNILIWQALQTRGIYYYIFPTYRQGRKALWEAIDSRGFRMLDYIPRECLGGKLSHTEMRITLSNGSIIRIVGSDDYDNVRGTNPIGVVLSEYAYQNPAIWDQVLEPILRLNGGWALFNSTPYGKNHFYSLYAYAKNHPEEWYSETVTIEDTGLLTEKDIDVLREQGIPEETIAQEYYCSFDRGVEGTYYGKPMMNARNEGRIGNVPFDPYTPVHTTWDLGMADACAIWWWQAVGKEIHFINYLEGSGESLQHYIKRVFDIGSERGYTYGNHYAPHDIQQRELGTGISRLDMARQLGIHFHVLQRTIFEAGIEATRKILPRCWFDQTNCKRGIQALEAYQKKWDEKNMCYSTQALHNWASHGSDAARYTAIAYELMLGATIMTLNEYRDMKKKYGLQPELRDVKHWEARPF